MALGHGDAKCVFTDYGKRVIYACVGPQTSQNSTTIRNHPPFMDALSDSHWRSGLWQYYKGDAKYVKDIKSRQDWMDGGRDDLH